MDKKQIDSMARVNHAGEYGAVRIYQGQHRVFSKSAPASVSASSSAKLTKEMLAHEEEHLAYFTEHIAKAHSRPTILLPLWHLGGFALGVATARLGRKAALACTQAVEEEIDRHYSNQIEELAGEESAFKQKLEKFRDDERDHHAIALAENKEDYPLLRASIGGLCRVAIALSSRF